MTYAPVIGLEVHIQSKTNSKMFCSCPTSYFGKKPNTQTCPTCLGLPGSLPTINKKAINHCIKLALSLHCKINQKTKFDRKNYFYPDLPKGYQITQFDLPIGYDGYLEIDINGDSRRIRITKIHQEEDTGKSIYKKDRTLLDFNKSGVPLIEVVSAPDFTEVKEVVEYAKELKRLVRYLGVSDADMEKGQMRFELNISLKETGSNDLPDYRVEIKNIGSISVLEKVINFEIQRQEKLLNTGKKPKQETRGLKNMSGQTVAQRSKEESADYRYFPEPDLPLIEISDNWIETISEQITELPRDKRHRFVRDYGLEPDIAYTITELQNRADWFEKAVKDEPQKIAKLTGYWFVGNFLSLFKKSKAKFNTLKIKPNYLAEVVKLHSDSKVSGATAKKILEESFETGKSPKEIMKMKNLEQLSNENQLSSIVRKIVKNNHQPVADYKKGKTNVLKYLIGQVMKETKGRANPKMAEEILKKHLA